MFVSYFVVVFPVHRVGFVDIDKSCMVIRSDNEATERSIDPARNAHVVARKSTFFFKDGDFVNLGIGVPLMCVNYLPEGVDLWLEAEIGTCLL